MPNLTGADSQNFFYKLLYSLGVIILTAVAAAFKDKMKEMLITAIQKLLFKEQLTTDQACHNSSQEVDESREECTVPISVQGNELTLNISVQDTDAEHNSQPSNDEKLTAIKTRIPEPTGSNPKYIITPKREVGTAIIATFHEIQKADKEYRKQKKEESKSRYFKNCCNMS